MRVSQAVVVAVYESLASVEVEAVLFVLVSMAVLPPWVSASPPPLVFLPPLASPLQVFLRHLYPALQVLGRL